MSGKGEAADEQQPPPASEPIDLTGDDDELPAITPMASAPQFPAAPTGIRPQPTARYRHEPDSVGPAGPAGANIGRESQPDAFRPQFVLVSGLPAGGRRWRTSSSSAYVRHRDFGHERNRRGRYADYVRDHADFFERDAKDDAFMLRWNRPKHLIRDYMDNDMGFYDLMPAPSNPVMSQATVAEAKRAEPGWVEQAQQEEEEKAGSSDSESTWSPERLEADWEAFEAEEVRSSGFKGMLRTDRELDRMAALPEPERSEKLFAEMRRRQADVETMINNDASRAMITQAENAVDQVHDLLDDVTVRRLQRESRGTKRRKKGKVWH